MPIEIKELHIKAVVVDRKNKPGASGDLPKRDLEKLKREIIRECVLEIMQILENKLER
jgi:hypothetical protein